MHDPQDKARRANMNNNKKKQKKTFKNEKICFVMPYSVSRGRRERSDRIDVTWCHLSQRWLGQLQDYKFEKEKKEQRWSGMCDPDLWSVLLCIVGNVGASQTTI